MIGQLHRTLTRDSIAILVSVFGAGRTIRVPGTTAKAQRFEVLIGLEQTTRLVEEFGGDRVYLPGLPPCSGKRQAPTLDEVKSRTDAGKSATAIALEFGCSARSIHEKRAKLKQIESERIAP